MQAAQKTDFWHFLRLVFVFFLGGTILSMFALQLSPSFRETALELVTLRREARQQAAQVKGAQVTLLVTEKSLRSCAMKSNEIHSEIEAERVKVTEIQAHWRRAIETTNEKKKVIERMDLEKTQQDQQLTLQASEIEKLKKENAKLELVHSQEKKDYETKTLECGSHKTEGEACKVDLRDVKNEMARLTLEHEQMKNEAAEREELCAAIKKKLDEREKATSKLLKNVKKDDLKKLLDPDDQTQDTQLNQERLKEMLTGDGEKRSEVSVEVSAESSVAAQVPKVEEFTANDPKTR